MSDVEYRPWPRDERYLVGDDGTVLSLSGHPMKPRPGRNGYLIINLSHGSRKQRTCAYVHAVVCETFHGPRPEGMQVAHESGDKLDNRASNLAWKTCRDNHADRARHGTAPVGALNGRALVGEDEVRAIRRAWVAAPQGGRDAYARELAARFGLSFRAVKKIVHRQTWPHVA